MVEGRQVVKLGQCVVDDRGIELITDDRRHLVPWNSIGPANKLIGVVFDLAAEPWFTMPLLREVLQHACNHFGWKMHQD